MKSMVCPRCKWKMVTEDNEVYSCPYCDYQEIDFDVRNRRLELEAEKKKEEEARLARLLREKEERRAQRTDPSGNTLIVHYTTNNPNVCMVVRLADSRQRDVMTDGQTLKFRLAPGQHVIVLKIGKINHNKTFIVPKSKEYVEINASWTGRPSIIVDQPEVEDDVALQPAGANSGQAGAAPVQAGPNAGQPVSVQAAPPKPEKPWEDMSLIERMFRKGTIAQWIIAGVILLMALAEFAVSPLGAVLMILGAAVITPACTEFLGGMLGADKRIPIKIACFVAGGILALVGVIIAAANTPMPTTEIAEKTSEPESVSSEPESIEETAQETEMPVAPRIDMKEGDYYIETGHSFAYMSDEAHVYIAIPISNNVIKVESWDRTFTVEREVTFNKDLGTYKIDDPENGFCWVDNQHTAFYFNVTDKNNSRLRSGKNVVFSISANEGDECKGTAYDEKIACYSYINDDWDEYRAILLTESLMKIEVWCKPTGLSDWIYNYDLFYIDLENGKTDFEWGDDTHSAFTITMIDPENSFYWKETKFVSYTLKNSDYQFKTVSDYLGLDSEQ